MNEKTIMKFSWHLVEPALIRRLLRCAYEQRNQFDEAATVTSVKKNQLAGVAERILGRPPATGLRQGLTGVLRAHWLPNAKAQDLATMTGYLNRFDTLANREQRLQFLAARNNNDNFRRILWRTFISAHKAPTKRAPTPAGSKASRSRMDLQGRGRVSPIDPYEHQEQAWNRLRKMQGGPHPRAGLLVIPTGGGKTATAVTWLLEGMQENPDLRVLWVADQRELVDQAAHAFADLATHMPSGFTRLLRTVHGGAGRASALADDQAHVICATRQSLIGKGLDQRAKDLLSQYMRGPRAVVIDEAHHAVSPTYQALISFLREVNPKMSLLGLTATPWPGGVGQAALLRETFPTNLVTVTTSQLVARGELARPVIHTFSTKQLIDVTDEEVKALLNRPDLPATIARKLDTHARNAQIVHLWQQRKETWGKTLVFAADIEHAETLKDAFTQMGAVASAMHSRSEDPAAKLAAFRNGTGPQVLISVGMLLEGVDIPSARTAFLARPTGSHIVMRQMVGRVLRGERAGGDPEAHVVEFSDRWTRNGVGLPAGSILGPSDLPAATTATPSAIEPGVGPGPLQLLATTVEGEALGADLENRVRDAMTGAYAHLGHDALLTSYRITGFYDLDHCRIPVFDHTALAWKQAAQWALDGGNKTGSSAKAIFDDLPEPRPEERDIDGFVGYCRSFAGSPPFVPQVVEFSMPQVARSLIEAESHSERERLDHLRREYETSLARSLYPDFQAFAEEVQRHVLTQLGVLEQGAIPEQIPEPLNDPAEKLRASSQRDLQALFRETAATGAKLIATEPGYVGFLDEDLPTIDWTKRVNQTSWAHWTWRRTTKAKGKPTIRVNRALRAPATQISDELLRYLIWHELCHHLTPGQGHTAEFRRLEALWPNHAQFDHELDTLHERYQLPGPSRSGM